MLANILITVGFFGIGSIFGALWSMNLVLKCYFKDPKNTILIFEKYKKTLGGNRCTKLKAE